jgi:hypothetical protein
MKTRIIEATNQNLNWGKFLVGRFDRELLVPSALISALPLPLLDQIGWNPRSVWVLDLQTCEGAAFTPTGVAKADLDKHRIWVCPLFEPFLEWLYQQDLTDIDALPALVELPHAEFAMRGYRREGGGDEQG